MPLDMSAYSFNICSFVVGRLCSLPLRDILELYQCTSGFYGCFDMFLHYNVTGVTSLTVFARGLIKFTLVCMPILSCPSDAL